MFKNIVISSIILASSLIASDSAINWAKDYKTGIESAKKENKPVMFVFSNHNCKWCMVLKNKTFTDEKVIRALNKDFISIVSYTDEQDYTPRKLVRPGTPAVWFLRKDGTPMFRSIDGAIDSKNLLIALAVVKTKFEESKK